MRCLSDDLILSSAVSFAISVFRFVRKKQKEKKTRKSLDTSFGDESKRKRERCPFLRGDQEKTKEFDWQLACVGGKVAIQIPSHNLCLSLDDSLILFYTYFLVLFLLLPEITEVALEPRL